MALEQIFLLKQIIIKTPEKNEMYEMMKDMIKKVEVYKDQHLRTYQKILDRHPDKVIVRQEFDDYVEKYLKQFQKFQKN